MRGELRAQLRLAVPVIAVQLGLIAMGAVDSAFMGRVSATHFAAVTLGHTWTFAFLAFGMGALAALDPVVSQAVGAGDQRGVARGVQRGLLLAVLLSVPTALAIVPAGPALVLLGQEPEVAAIAADYALASIAGVPGFLIFVALRQSLQALHVVRPILAAILVTNVVNAALDWVLIFGNLGFPALGAVGSAWATVAARWGMALFIIPFAWPRLASVLVPLDPRAFAWRPLARMLRVGAPVGVQFVIEIGAFGTISILMGWFGERELSGHQVALQLASISFMVPLGISMAAAVRVGTAVGRRDALGVRRAAGVALALGAGAMLVSGALFLALPGRLIALFTDLEGVRAVALVLVPLAGIFQVFDGTQVVAIGVLRGTADTLWPSVIHLIGFWCVGVPLAYVLAFGLGVGPAGLWWGLAAALAAVALVQVLRLVVRLSHAVERVVIDDDDAGPGA